MATTDIDSRIANIDPDKVDDYISSPMYPTVMDYPESISVGDKLFPLLYIYYFGNPTDYSKISNTNLFTKGMEDYIELISAVGGYSESKSAQMITTWVKSTQALKKFRLMFDSACKNNPQFVWLMANAASAAMKKYSSRLSYDDERPLPGSTYYRQHLPNGKTKFSSVPAINGNTGTDIGTSMEALRILFENGLLTYDYDLGIRPINIFTGEMSEEKEELNKENVTARYLGLPTRGIFTASKTKKGSSMYHTFSGIDINALASLDTNVADLNQLLSLSWSIHRGTTSLRTVGKASPGGRVKGGRTVAGTMVFALTDHHPLRDIIPDTWEGRKTQVLNDPDNWKPLVMADEIPGFDLVLTLTNEYGFAAITTLYGVQIADEGGVFGMDNLMTEMVLQYTAVAMDPIMEVSLDENGVIDPFGILQGGYSKMWRKRELISAGAGFSDLEAAYERYYDTVLFTPKVRSK